MKSSERRRDAVWQDWAKPKPTDDLWSWQDGRCAWCGSDRQNLVRDHCHITGLIRGLLCGGCNTRECTGFGPDWEGWRAGFNTANEIGHYEIYANQVGLCEISPRSALNFYSPDEQAVWCGSIVEQLAAGQATWPTEVPWTDAAKKRQAARMDEMRAVMERAFAPLTDLIAGKKSA